MSKGIIFFALILFGLLPTSHAQPATQKHLKTCYMLFGPLSDHGYTFAHNKGRMAAHRAFSLNYPNISLESDYVLNAFFGDAKAIAQDFVNRGCEVIHATSPAFTDTIMPFVEKYPNITFSLQNGWGIMSDNHPNLVINAVRSYEPWYVAGVTAALNRKRCIAFIAAHDNNAEVLSCVNSFILGVRSVLPTEVVHFMTLGSWYDPPRSDMAARAFHEGLGCDVIAEYSDSFQAAQYALENNLQAIQMHGQANEFFGDNVLTCVYTDWSSIYYDITVDRALGVPPRNRWPFVYAARLCPLSARANSASFARVSESSKQTNVFLSWPDSALKSISTFLPELSRNVLHHGRPRLSDELCTVMGQVLVVTAPLTATDKIQFKCVQCPPQTAAIDGKCVSCATPKAALTAQCTSVTSDDLGIVVGPIAGLILLLIVVVCVIFFQRGQLKRLTRDVKHAPQEKVAIIFTDVQNSTDLWNQKPAEMKIAMDIHHRTVRQVIAKHKAYEVKTLGDSFMIAVKGADTAVRVCNDIQSELLAEKWPAEILDSSYACTKFEDKNLVFKGLRVRMGIDFGNPNVVFDEVSKGFDYYGDIPNIASRVEGIAYGGQTLITKNVYAELSPNVCSECNWVDVGKVSLKGVTEGVHVYQVLPKDLVRHFSMPVEQSSGCNKSSLGEKSSAISNKREIEEMTMTEIVKELRRVRAAMTSAEAKRTDFKVPTIESREDMAEAQETSPAAILHPLEPPND